MLPAILAQKRLEIEAMLAEPEVMPRRSPKGGVVDVLSRRPASTPLRLIAEVKPRSPSAGLLSSALRPAERAVRYARAGASMVSVLTDAAFFGGSFDDLAACRDRLDAELGPARPLLLCKDFILHPRQLDRAVDAGADAALLIVRILDAGTLATLVTEAVARGLTPLVEVVTDEERLRARQAGARLIGVNARDLDTLEMDREGAARVLAALDDTVVAVHLSGLATPADVAAVAEGRAEAALIGEALMRQDDPSELLGRMVEAARAASTR